MTAPPRKPRFSRARPTASGGLRRARDDEAKRIEVRVKFPQPLIALMDEEARELGMERYRWIFALVRHHLTGQPRFRRPAELSLFQAHSELRRMRTELLMIRRALETGSHQALSASLIAILDEHQQALEAAMTGVRQAVQGNLNYWRTSS